MSDGQAVAGGPWIQSPAAAPFTINPIADSSMPPGTPVCRAADKVSPGDANTLPTATIVGLTTRKSATGERVPVQFADLLTLSTAQWDAVTGQTGGLTEGAQYFLSTDTGKLSSTPPATLNPLLKKSSTKFDPRIPAVYDAPVGVAWSATTMMILPQAPRL
jgi:hypothetical protein